MADLDWIRDLFERIDAKDVDGLLAFLADDAQSRFGNAPALSGKDAIREGVEGFFASVQASRHSIANIWPHPYTVICQGDVAYTRLNGSQLTVPFVDVFGMAGDRIREYLIYIDISSLYSRAD